MYELKTAYVTVSFNHELAEFTPTGLMETKNTTIILQN